MVVLRGKAVSCERGVFVQDSEGKILALAFR
jgi:hypothetical protein